MRVPFVFALAAVVACGATNDLKLPPGGDSPDAQGDGRSMSPSADGGSPNTDGSSPNPNPNPADRSSSAGLAMKLRGANHFMIGLGNDLADDHDQDGAYTLGTTLDLHYAYLVGLTGEGGWTDWNEGGTFVNMLADSAAAHNVTPMFTLYQMAAWGDGNIGVLSDDAYMQKYWTGAKLLFQRLAVFDKPAVVHLEPDFWGYVVLQSPDATLAAKTRVLADDCADVPENVRGMATCLVRLARKYSPKVAVGFHASTWGGEPSVQVPFLKAIGADQADFVSTDMLDRDAGCFEAHTDPNCQRQGSGWYWSDDDFHTHLAWSKAIRDGVNLPFMWWQIPLGVPSSTPGGTAGHYRDNRVQYLFAHVNEFVAAGGFAAAFGTGVGNQTDITTDGNQFRNAVTAYYQSPVALP